MKTSSRSDAVLTEAHSSLCYLQACPLWQELRREHSDSKPKHSRLKDARKDDQCFEKGQSMFSKSYRNEAFLPQAGQRTGLHCGLNTTPWCPTGRCGSFSPSVRQSVKSNPLTHPTTKHSFKDHHHYLIVHLLLSLIFGKVPHAALHNNHALLFPSPLVYHWQKPLVFLENGMDVWLSFWP